MNRSTSSFGQKVPCRIDQQPAPGETRPVRDANAGDGPLDAVGSLPAAGLGREQLPQGLDAVKQAGRCCSADVDPPGCDLQRVSFLAEFAVQGIVQRQRDQRRIRRLGFRQLQFEAQCRRQGSDQLASFRDGRPGRPDRRVGGQPELAFADLQRDRLGDQGHVRTARRKWFGAARGGKACHAQPGK